MATYTLTPFKETNSKRERLKYEQVKTFADLEALQVTDNRVDNFSRLCTVESCKIERAAELHVVGLVTLFKARGRDLSSGESLSCRIRFLAASGKFLEVAVTHNFPYVRRENITTRRYDGSVAKEMATGRNFTLNSWDESPYHLEISVSPSRMVVEVNNGWFLGDTAGIGEEIEEIKLYRVFRTVDNQAFPGKYDDSIIEKISATVNRSNKTLIFSQRLLELTKKTYTFSLKYVMLVDENSLVSEPVVTGQPASATRPTSELERLQMVGTLDKLVVERGKAVYDTPEGVFNVKESDIYDERFMDKVEALKVNSRLNALMYNLGSDGSVTDKGNFLVGLIQLFLLYSTVKHPTLNPAYKIRIVLNGREVDLSFQAIRRAILDGDDDYSSTNKVRTYMRYYGNTAVSLLLSGKIQPAYTAAAKHGVPKKFLPFCFDFAILDSRYYTQDVLKANALASAYAIKLAKEKGEGKEQYNLLAS